MPLSETSEMADRATYDLLVQCCKDPRDLSEDFREELSSLDAIEDDNTKGEEFEELLGRAFSRLGFSARTRDGVRERKSNLNYERPGGGDVGLFHHFPVLARGELHPGYAIACEAKASRFPVGSIAVSQARNLADKIREQFSSYLVHKTVISRSTSGYDRSGRDQAPPDVIHLSTDVLAWLLNKQVESYEQGLPLLTPYKVLALLDALIRNQVLEPQTSDVERMISS